MPVPVLGGKGAALDLLIRQGSTHGPNFTTLKDGTGAAINITGATITAQVRKTPDALTVAAPVVCTLVTPASGTFTWSISATATAALTCDPIDELAEDSQYVWDMEILYADGRVQPLMYGAVSVFREVTKP